MLSQPDIHLREARLYVAGANQFFKLCLFLCKLEGKKNAFFKVQKSLYSRNTQRVPLIIWE